MKASIICPNTYTEPGAWGRPFPVPRAAFAAESGQNMLAAALEQARAADEAGSRPAASMRTTDASCSSCTPSVSTAAIHRKM